MAFSFELKLAISSELYGAISAGPEQCSRSPFGEKILNLHDVEKELPCA